MLTTKAKIVFLLGWLSGLMMMFTMLQLGWLRETYSRERQQPLATPQDAGYCPPCDVLFPELERSPDSGKLVQRVEMQMRGWVSSSSFPRRGGGDSSSLGVVCCCRFSH